MNKSLSTRLKRASKKGQPAVAAVIAEELGRRGIEAILVGGAAVEFYTDGNGGFITQDIDFVSVDSPAAITRIMKSLGFEQAGRGFTFADPPIFVEFPGGSLDPPGPPVTASVAGRVLKLISLEGIFIDRLRALTYWKTERDAAQAVELLLLHDEEMDWTYIRRICKGDADLRRKLQAVRRLAKRVAYGRSDADELKKLAGG